MPIVLALVIGFLFGAATGISFYDREIAAGKLVVEAANHMEHNALQKAHDVLAAAIRTVRARL